MCSASAERVEHLSGGQQQFTHQPPSLHTHHAEHASAAFLWAGLCGSGAMPACCAQQAAAAPAAEEGVPDAGEDPETAPLVEPVQLEAVRVAGEVKRPPTVPTERIIDGMYRCRSLKSVAASRSAGQDIIRPSGQAVPLTWTPLRPRYTPPNPTPYSVSCEGPLGGTREPNCGGWATTVSGDVITV